MRAAPVVICRRMSDLTKLAAYDVPEFGAGRAATIPATVYAYRA